jgi:hypothetical protein
VKEAEMAEQGSKNGSRSYSRRASDMLDSAWEGATAPRVAAAGAVALGALAFAYMRDKDRRDRLTRTARDYSDRASNWWHGSQKSSTASQPTAPMVG